MTHNQLVQAMAKRAGVLSAQTVKQLRLEYPDNVAGTKTGSQWALSKAKLVEQILYDEFEIEFDYELTVE